MQKKLLSILLCVCLLAGTITAPAMAANANISFSVSETAIQVGDTIEVIITNDVMTLAGFGGYLEYDSSLLECISVKGIAQGEETPEEGYLHAAGSGKAIPFMVYDNTANTNKDGIHSFAYVTVQDSKYSAGTISKLTFKAKASGTATFTLTEDSSGKDGYQNVAKTTRVSITSDNVLKPESSQTSAAKPSDDCNDYESKIVLQIGTKDVYVNDKKISNDVAPVIVGNRTMVPIRVIMEALGGNVAWDAANRTVTIGIDDKVLKLVIGKEIPGFGTGAIIQDNRTYVPIRYVSEYAGARVQWIPETQTIIVEK